MMPIHPDIAAIAERAGQRPTVDLDRLPPVQAARQLRDQRATPPAITRAAARCEDRMLARPGLAPVAIRIYWPTDPTGAALMNYHGGGWVMGDLSSDDYRCHFIAATTGCLVISVDYRLAPEHPFPAPLDDCIDALLWLFDNSDDLGIDRNRIGVSGSSAGANLAAAVAVAIRDRKLLPDDIRLCAQQLYYPIIDPSGKAPSWSENATMFPLSAASMRWFWHQYVGPDLTDVPPLAALGLVGDLTDLPAAEIVTAQYDILRDEGETFAMRLVAAGVPVTMRRVAGMVHGFVSVAPASLPSQRSLALSAAWLRATFAVQA